MSLNKASSTEAKNAQRSGAFSQYATGTVPGLVNSGYFPVNPMVAAIRQQEAQRLLIAAAMANASNNLLAGGQLPVHEAYRYQQDLLAQGGHPGSAHYGGGIHPFTSFPLQLPTPAPSLPNMPMATRNIQPSIPKRTKPSHVKDNEPSDKKKIKYKPYFDGSTVPDEESCSDEDNITTRRGEAPQKGTAEMSAKERLNEAFPKKLYRIIDDAKKNGHDDIISFFPHGRAFAIHRPKEFVEEIMPKYMSTSRMTSFQRQLNLYNFKRITEGKDRGGYYHEYFLQGRKGLLTKIKRKKPTTPKCTRQDLDQAARISNAILSSNKYAPTYTYKMSMMADPMMQPQQMAGRSPDESYANAMRTQGFGSSAVGPSSLVAAPRDHSYPNVMETEAPP
jgi:hypothetical protein